MPIYYLYFCMRFIPLKMRIKIFFMNIYSAEKFKHLNKRINERKADEELILSLSLLSPVDTTSIYLVEYFLFRLDFSQFSSSIKNLLPYSLYYYGYNVLHICTIHIYSMWIKTDCELLVFFCLWLSVIHFNWTKIGLKHIQCAPQLRVTYRTYTHCTFTDVFVCVRATKLKWKIIMISQTICWIDRRKFKRV